MAVDVPALRLDEVIDSSVRVHLPVLQPSDDDLDSLISTYLHQIKELERGNADQQSRLGKAEAGKLVLELLGFGSQVNGEEGWPIEYRPLGISERQAAGLIVLAVRAFDMYEWTKDQRAAGRLGILNLALIMLGQHKALNDLTEPPQSPYWQCRI